MSVAVCKEPSGLYCIRVSGVFTDEDRREMESAGRAIFERSGTIRVLILAEAFPAREKGRLGKP